MKRLTPEAALLKLCLEWLTLKNVWHVRINSGAFALTDGGKRRFFRASVAGFSDLLIVIRGAALFAELKAPDGVQTELQRAFGERVLQAGGRYAVVRTLDELIAAVEAMRT